MLPDDEFEREHPSYGILHISRTSGGTSAIRLFGSPLATHSHGRSSTTVCSSPKSLVGRPQCGQSCAGRARPSSSSSIDTSTSRAMRTAKLAVTPRRPLTIFPSVSGLQWSAAATVIHPPVRTRR